MDVRGTNRVYYRTTGGLYWKVFTDFAPSFSVNGKPGHSTRETSFSSRTPQAVTALIAILGSDLFWWWYTITSNLRDLNPFDIQNFPIPEAAILDKKIGELGEALSADMKANSVLLVRNQKQTGRTETQSFIVSKSKPVIDLIDHTLAPHYKLTQDELDFIKNYDVKHRLGSDDEESKPDGND
jgi:hypothetical protein